MKRLSNGVPSHAMATTLVHLPSDVIIKIMIESGLRVKDVSRLCSVSTAFRELCLRKEIWRRVMIKLFGREVLPDLGVLMNPIERMILYTNIESAVRQHNIFSTSMLVFRSKHVSIRIVYRDNFVSLELLAAKRKLFGNTPEVDLEELTRFIYSKLSKYPMQMGRRDIQFTTMFTTVQEKIQLTEDITTIALLAGFKLDEPTDPSRLSDMELNMCIQCREKPAMLQERVNTRRMYCSKQCVIAFHSVQKETHV